MKRAQGFSLIELMLALALGVIVTAGIVALFVGNNQTYTLLNGQSRMQENARFAVDFISRSARAAGYFGCDPEPGKIYKTLNGAWNQIFEFDITTPIQAFHGTGGGNTVNDWTPALPVTSAAPRKPERSTRRSTARGTRYSSSTSRRRFKRSTEPAAATP